MLKGVASSIATVLVKIFNLSILKAKAPSRWKFSRVVPILKGSSTVQVFRLDLAMLHYDLDLLNAV